MRILVAHNFYQHPGGEDEVFRSELALLEAYGHSARSFEMHNEDVRSMNRPTLLGATIWNSAAASRLRQAARSHRADVVHFHNTFPLMSPAAYYAARAEGAAVVQTLHNYRLLCPGANFYRDARPCEDCLGKTLPLPGVRHRCYRSSISATAATSAMLAFHRLIGTWNNAVDAYITPTAFAREKFIAGGFPPDKLFVKPNFVHPDPGVGQGGGGYAIFVARLSAEKGLDTLLSAWEILGREVPLKIIGDGPLDEHVRQAVAKNPGIEWLGRRDLDEVYQRIGDADVLIFPSNCYETFGRVAIEAFARGTPVIASDHGAPADVVQEGVTGLRFRPGDGADLASKVRQILGDRARLPELRRNARAEFEAHYTGERNHELLASIYARVRERFPRSSNKPAQAPLTAS